MPASLAEEETSNYVIRELLMAVWRKQGWPMQAMGFDQWDQLASMLAESGLPDVAAGDAAAEEIQADVPRQHHGRDRRGMVADWERGKERMRDEG